MQAQSCLFATPWAVAHPGSSVHGISQARTLEQLPFPPPRDLPDPGIEPVSPALAGGFLATDPPGKPVLYIISVKSEDLLVC